MGVATAAFVLAAFAVSWLIVGATRIWWRDRSILPIDIQASMAVFWFAAVGCMAAGLWGFAIYSAAWLWLLGVMVAWKLREYE